MGQKEKAIMMVRKAEPLRLTGAFVHSTRIQIALRSWKNSDFTKKYKEAEKKSQIENWRGTQHPGGADVDELSSPCKGYRLREGERDFEGIEWIARASNIGTIHPSC